MSIEAPATVYFPDSISDIKDCMDKTDDDGILQIYSYKECNDQSTDKLKQSRGLIFCGDKFLFPSIGYTPDCVIGDGNVQKEEYISELIRNHGSYLQFFSSTEGTLLRVFYYNKWYISTHRKLDAYQSKWGNSSVSFGKTMEEALTTINLTKDSLLENLDKECLFFLCEHYVRHQNGFVGSGETNHRSYGYFGRRKDVFVVLSVTYPSSYSDCVHYSR
jgi:hypothetical protein